MVAYNRSSPFFKAGITESDREARATASQQAAAEDAILVRRFKAGDDAAFVEIILRYRVKMAAIAFSFLRNSADAEEIAQDTFIRAHRSLLDFRGDSSLATWLHRITINLSRNRYWHFFRRKRHLTQSLDRPFSEANSGSVGDVMPSDAPGPAREAMTEEFTAEVAECMEQLKPQERDILTRLSQINSSYVEIGAALGINVGTVKSRIARARTSLRGLLAEACPTFPANAAPIDWFEPIRPSLG